jgi:diguanylate cyclase (GGDEF)-like protein
MNERSPEHRPQVLVVDDDPTMRLLLRETLELVDFAVVDAATGEEALELLASALPSMVMLDVGLPGIDGFEVCRRMRAVADPARLPIIMVTGMDDLESIDRAYQVGATDFISKPINWPVLGHRARYVLRGARAIRDLRAAETRQSAMLRAIPDMMFTLDGAGNCIDYQPGVRVAAPIAAEQLLGRNIRDVLPADVATTVLDALCRATASGEIQSANIVLRIRDEQRHFEARMALAGANEILALVRDVTGQRRNEEKIRTLAYCDSLTGLPNRQAFVERLDEEIARIAPDGGQLAVIFLDLDGFKRINDTLGHNAGDYLLQSVAERLASEMRATDVVARALATPDSAGFARLGGDEFTIMLPRIDDLRLVATVADRVRELISRPFIVSGQEIVVTASLGVALFPGDGVDGATLLKHADTAMYHAKDAGRNNWQMYSAALTTRARMRLEIENDLRRALDRREFFLHYQPQAVAADGTIASVEALLRWNHPQRGIVSPLEFIPVAEETGFIIPIGRWVLFEACRAARRWRDQGPGAIRTAVNLSGRQLRDPKFVDDVRAAIAEAGIGADVLELELTESILMDSADATVARMRALRDDGVSFSIDDFGTGYSSMSYLKRFPIGTLKIDRSFVRGLPLESDDVAITRAIISMAHSLRMDVVAEGVESTAQAAFLRAAGCDKLQGYLYGKPMSEQAIAELVRTQSSPATDPAVEAFGGLI